MRVVLLLLCPLIICASSWGADDQTKGDPQPLGLTKFDHKIIDAHEQGFPMSCIPSSVEMLLKLLGRVPNSYRDLQLAWQNKSDGCWRDFNGKTFAGVTLRYRDDYSTDQLFEAIDRGLAVPEADRPQHIRVRSRRMSGAELDYADVLKERRDKRGAELEIDPTIIASRGTLFALGRKEPGEWERLLPWQRDILKD